MHRGVVSVTRAVEILGFIADSDEYPTLRDIVTQLSIPKSTAFDLIETMIESGVVAKVDLPRAPTRFALGIRLFQFGSAFVRDADVARLGQEATATLSGQTGETSHVAVLDGADVVYIARAEGNQAVRMVSALGKRVPAHCTAVGKALLAALDIEEMRQRFPPSGELERLTPNTIPTVEELERALERIRKDGASIERCESNIDVCCAAAPIRDGTGEVIAAISVSVPENRWNTVGETTWIGFAREAANDISARLGFDTETHPLITLRPV